MNESREQDRGQAGTGQGTHRATSQVEMSVWRSSKPREKFCQASHTNAMVAMVRHGRAPDDGAANGSISASLLLATSSLKSTNVDVRMHMHASMEPVGFYTHQHGETTPIWPFPCAPTRFDLGRSHWSTVQMSEMGAGSWGGRRFSTLQYVMRWCTIISCMKHHVIMTSHERVVLKNTVFDLQHGRSPWGLGIRGWEFRTT